MYMKNDKKRLYWLIDEYLSDKIDEAKFCDEFYYSYSLELNHSIFSDVEKREFSNLDEVASRFSEFEEDHQLDAKAFTTRSELRAKIMEAKEKLNIIDSGQN